MKAIARLLLLTFTVAVIIASVQKCSRKAEVMHSPEITLNTETTLSSESVLVPELITPTEETQPAYDVTRCSFDIGTCRTLAEDAAIVLLCVDDDASSWDEASVQRIYTQTEAAAQYLRDQAASYGFTLELPVYTYATNENRQIRFDGTITTGGEKCDALSSISRNWGFDDKWDLHRTLQEQLQMEQIAYIVAHNKDGNSFAQAEDYRSPGKYDWCMPEYSIIASPEGSDIAETILHETLHIFGAQDFYRKEWELDSGNIVYNEDRARMAKALYPYEIMLCTTSDMDRIQLSDFTAYTVGWLDAMPEEYNCDPWWVGSQWEEIYAPASVAPVYYNNRALPVDKNRYSYNLGSLRTLKEDAAVALLYMDDNESNWDAAAMETVYENTAQAMDFMRNSASAYGYHLTLPILTYGGEETPLIYDGVILNGGEQLDALTHAAKSMGFADKWEMHDSIRDEAGMEQIIYIVAHNKDGLSYAQADQDNESNTKLEYCVIAHNKNRTPPAVYTHEILHLFGAQDIYEKVRNDVTYNAGRQQMAQELFPTEIMLESWIPLSDTVVCDFTAFCVGWLDEMPETYNCDAWWDDTQERESFPYSIGEYTP